MEDFFGGAIVIIALLLFFAPALIIRPIKAIFSRLVHGGKYTDHLKNEFTGMSGFESKVELRPADDDTPFEVFELSVRGEIPVSRMTNVSFAVSVFDANDPEDLMPIVCNIDDFCEPQSAVFQFGGVLGDVPTRSGYKQWQRLGGVIPSIIVPPRGGKRRLRIVTRLFDTDRPVNIFLGSVTDNEGALIAAIYSDVMYEFDIKGYEETAEARRKLRPLSISLAVAVAFADGSFDDSEGATIKTWIERQLTMVSEDSQDEIREECNSALRDAYAQGAAGELSLSVLCNQVVATSETSQRYEAIELCLDVMAADGIADPTELEIIRKVADIFELDVDELQKLKDQRMVTIDTTGTFETSDAAANEVLGIDPSWPNDRIKKHLRDEFRKWNSRLNNLSEQSERDNVQARIDLISEARKRYE